MHRTRLTLPLIAVLIGSLSVAPVPAVADGAEPTITVTPNRYVTSDGRPVSRIPATIIGANHRWPDDGKGMWDPTTDTAVGGIDEIARRTNLDLVRYPGGTVANLFDFTRAIGPQTERGCQTSGGFANGLFRPTDSRYGPDEQQKFVRSIGAETMIMVPSINRSAADAADYVEYMNSPADGARTNPNGGTDWAEVRAANGHPASYKIKTWEYGNEPYLPNQRYWRSPDPDLKLRQFIEGGWQHQTATSDPYADNDGLFSGCDLATRRTGSGQPGQSYRVRFPPIAMPGDEAGSTGAGDGSITAPVLRVNGEIWTLVDSLAAAGPDDPVYTITRKTGGVHFGDGAHGQIPPQGASLSIDYTSGVHDGFLAFRDAMKAVDPSITVCAGWGRQEFIDAMGTRAYDCLDVHSYTTPAADGTPLRYNNLQAGAAGPTNDLAGYRRQLAAYFPDPRRRPRLIVSEYGTLNVPIKNFDATLAHNLYLAALLDGQLENDVRASTVSNMNGLGDPANPSYGELFGKSPNFLDTGRAKLLSLYARMVGDVTITTSIENNPQLTAASGPYDGLRAVASCSGPTTRLMVINRDQEQPVTAEVDLPGTAGSDLRISTLNGPSVGSFNTDAAPDTVSITTTNERITGHMHEQVFQPHSVTLLEQPTSRNRSGCPVE